MQIVVVGAGYVGAMAGEMLAQAGHHVTCTRRGAPAAAGAATWRALEVADALRPAWWPGDVHAVLYAVAPGGGTDEAYKLGYHDGLANVLQWCGETTRIVLLSSTGVYAQDDGSLLDESSIAAATRTGIPWLLRAEQLLATRPPSCVLRLGGIYGPGRDRMVRIAREPSPQTQGLYTNRIHQTDAAGAAVHCLLNANVPKVLIGVDTEPATDSEVVAYLRAQLNLPAADLAQTNSAQGKRLSSAALVRSGYMHAYPTFREGFGQILACTQAQ
jgi:nucleoside-diphosphate-sugar epimerase